MQTSSQIDILIQEELLVIQADAIIAIILVL